MGVLTQINGTTRLRQQNRVRLSSHTNKVGLVLTGARFHSAVPRSDHTCYRPPPDHPPSPPQTVLCRLWSDGRSSMDPDTGWQWGSINRHIQSCVKGSDPCWCQYETKQVVPGTTKTYPSQTCYLIYSSQTSSNVKLINSCSNYVKPFKQIYKEIMNVVLSVTFDFNKK